jgi:methylphosphotriester-DNA--protein-cysteine methyltransferase
MKSVQREGKGILHYLSRGIKCGGMEISMGIQHLYRLMSGEMNMGAVKELQGCFYYERRGEEQFVLLPGNGTDYLWDAKGKNVIVTAYPNQLYELEKNGEFWGFHFSSIDLVEAKVDKMTALFSQLNQCDSFERRLFQVRKEAEGIFVKQKIHPVLQKAVAEIEQAKGFIGVEEVRSRLSYDYSMRQLERLFKETYSYGPKQFCRKERILYMLEYILEHSGSRIQWAVEQAGYSDRSHFQREFQHFFGMTPVQFLQKYCHKETIVI